MSDRHVRCAQSICVFHQSCVHIQSALKEKVVTKLAEAYGKNLVITEKTKIAQCDASMCLCVC